jgi:NADH-quinone oxidoreductase subunit J
MTTRPRLIEIDRRLLAGLIPLGLFAVVAAIVLTTEFGAPQGFADGGLTIVEDIGYALIGAPEHATLGVEDFLVALILIAVLLDAALDGALMLAKRDDGGEN